MKLTDYNTQLLTEFLDRNSTDYVGKKLIGLAIPNGKRLTITSIYHPETRKVRSASINVDGMSVPYEIVRKLKYKELSIKQKFRMFFGFSDYYTNEIGNTIMHEIAVKLNDVLTNTLKGNIEDVRIIGTLLTDDSFVIHSIFSKLPGKEYQLFEYEEMEEFVNKYLEYDIAKKIYSRTPKFKSKVVVPLKKIINQGTYKQIPLDIQEIIIRGADFVSSFKPIING